LISGTLWPQDGLRQISPTPAAHLTAPAVLILASSRWLEGKIDTKKPARPVPQKSKLLSFLVDRYYNEKAKFEGSEMRAIDYVAGFWKLFEDEEFAMQEAVEKTALDLYKKDKDLARSFPTTYSNGLGLQKAVRGEDYGGKQHANSHGYSPKSLHFDSSLIRADRLSPKQPVENLN
jgi:hypothetical protein